MSKVKPTRIYHPKGSMCMNCKHVNRDCTDLNFKEMKVIGQYSGNAQPFHFKIVKCEEFEQ